MDDEATLEFNQWQQASELKALNRRTGRGDLRSFPFPVSDPGQAIRDNWTVLDDMNASLTSWGWQATARADWYGTKASGWAARLAASD